MQGNKKNETRNLPEYVLIKTGERGWVPLSRLEIEHRGWNKEYMVQKVMDGEIKLKYTNDNTAVIFERVDDKAKYRHLRKWADWSYEKRERELAEEADVPYWYDVVKQEELKRQEEAKRKEESSFVNVIYGFFSVIGAVLGFIFQVIVVVCCIFWARNATQWFLGTGKYSKRE